MSILRDGYSYPLIYRTVKEKRVSNFVIAPMSNEPKVDFIVGIMFINFVLCPIITYHQVFSDNVASVRFVLYLQFSCENEKDKQDII